MKKNHYIAYALAAVLILAALVWGITTNRGVKAPVISGSVNTITEGSSAFGPSESVSLGAVQSVIWDTSKYPGSQVSVQVIRKVSDNPATYELVRSVSASTANDGSALWVPSEKDLGDNLFVEVGCQLSDTACRASISSSPLAVNYSSDYLNVANTYQAIEQLYNR